MMMVGAGNNNNNNNNNSKYKLHLFTGFCCWFFPLLFACFMFCELE